MDELEQTLYHRCGLLGLSGVSDDVQTLSSSADPNAAFALEYFALKVAQFVGMMAVSMGGVDAIVFTGGIGENAQSVRDAIMARLAFLNVPTTIVIPANEERLMAIEAKRLLDLLVDAS